MLAAHLGVGGGDGGDDPAEQRRAALPHAQGVERPVGVVAEVVEDVGEAGADEGGDDGSGQEPIDDGVVDAAGAGGGEQEAGAGEEPDGGADAVRGDGERPGREVEDRGVVQEGERHCWLSW